VSRWQDNGGVWLYDSSRQWRHLGHARAALPHTCARLIQTPFAEATARFGLTLKALLHPSSSNSDKLASGAKPKTTKEDQAWTRVCSIFSPEVQPFYAAALFQFRNLIWTGVGVYKAWNPPRVTDAREMYRRAWQLRCANENSYRHWAQMEFILGNFGQRVVN
jgi:hypothetical protein